LREIDSALAPHVRSLRLVVLDDAPKTTRGKSSPNWVPSSRGALRSPRAQSIVDTAPSLMEAYRRSLEPRPDFVLQVDGDGQFLGSDLRRALVLLMDESHAVSGVRRFRQDPVFRMIMNRFVRAVRGLGVLSSCA